MITPLCNLHENERIQLKLTEKVYVKKFRVQSGSPESLTLKILSELHACR